MIIIVAHHDDGNQHDFYDHCDQLGHSDHIIVIKKIDFLDIFLHRWDHDHDYHCDEHDHDYDYLQKAM